MAWNRRKQRHQRSDIADLLEGAFGAAWRKLAHPYLRCTSRAVRYWLEGQRGMQPRAVIMLRRRAEARLLELDRLAEMDRQRCDERAKRRRAVTERAIAISYQLQKEAIIRTQLITSRNGLPGYRETDLLSDDPF